MKRGVLFLKVWIILYLEYGKKQNWKGSYVFKGVKLCLFLIMDIFLVFAVTAEHTSVARFYSNMILNTEWILLICHLKNTF